MSHTNTLILRLLTQTTGIPLFIKKTNPLLWVWAKALPRVYHTLTDELMMHCLTQINLQIATTTTPTSDDSADVYRRSTEC